MTHTIRTPWAAACTPALSAISLASAIALTACGGGGGGTDSGSMSSATSATVPVVVSDASSQDWSAIQVTLTSVVLVSASGNTANLLSAPLSVNLEQLDNLGELIGNAQLTPGATYTGALLTIAANPGDISLTVASDPETGFPETASTATSPNVIPASRIQIQHAQGAVGSQTVAIPVTFTTPYVAPAAGASASSAINIEFDLSHPAFLVGHVPVGGGSTIWAINFKGPVHHKPVVDLRRLVLRHLYATAGAVSSDNTTLNVTRDLPTHPLVSPETYTATSDALAIHVDGANGTLFYDLDAKTVVTIRDYSSVAATLAKEPNLRIAARYQQDGTLVATRIYASATFNTVFVSPEGHVVHVDSVAGTGFMVDNADGKPTRVAVNAATQFFFRNPGSSADVTPIGTGPAFLTSHELARGFKVHVTPVDALAVPMVAAAVDIEAAPFEGKVGNVTTTGFALTDAFATLADDYSVTLNYISDASANGNDPQSGNAITGFKYWDFAYPSLVTSGAGATASFGSATGGAVNFGGTANGYQARALAYTVWGDAANLNGWSAAKAILIPTLLPRTTVASGVVGNSFTVGAVGGTTPVAVDFSTASGSATLAYQVDRTGNVVTVSAQDLSTTDGQAAFTAGLQSGAKVQISAVPQANGHLKAYVVSYFTGTQVQ